MHPIFENLILQILVIIFTTIAFYLMPIITPFSGELGPQAPI